MRRNIVTIITFLFLFLLLLVGCSSSGEIVLQMTGNIANEMAWTENQLKKMDIIEAEYTSKDGKVSTHTGVPIAGLLNQAEPTSDAGVVVFMGDDGYTAEATLDEVINCTDCIVALLDQGGFNIVMPGFTGKLQVKSVVEIQVK